MNNIKRSLASILLVTVAMVSLAGCSTPWSKVNTIYDGGAIIAEISVDQKAAIAEQSSNNG